MNKPKIIHADYIKAGASETTTQELEALSTSQLSAVRRRVAENDKTPANTLELLSQDEDSDVRIAAGLNKNISEDSIARLASDQNSDVRIWLASTSYMPEIVLQKLSTDENPHVSEQANRMIMARNDAIARIIVSFEFFSDDHKKVIATLQELIEQYNHWPAERLVNETNTVLDRIRKHLERARTMCLGWLDNLHLDQSAKHDVFKRSVEDEADLMSNISELICAQDNTVVPIDRLNALLERMTAHKELHENELFIEIRKHSPENIIRKV